MMVLTLVWVLLTAVTVAWFYQRHKNSSRSCQELENKLLVAEQARAAEHRAVQELQSKLLLKEGETVEQAKKIKTFELIVEECDRRTNTLKEQLQQKEVARAQLQQQLKRAQLAEQNSSRRTPTLLAKSREGTPIQTSSLLLGLDPELINTPVAELFATPYSITSAPRTRIADLQIQLETATASLKAAEQERDEAHNTIQRLEQDCASLDQQVEQIKAEREEQVSEMLASLQEVQSALEFSNQERDALAKELKEQRTAASEQAASAAQALASAEQQLVQAQESAKQYETQLSDAILKLGLLETQLHGLQQEKQQSTVFAKQLSDMEDEVKSAKASAEELRSTMQAAKMQAQAEVEKLEAEWSSSMAALKEQLEAQVAEVEKVSADRDQLVESLEDVQRQLSASRKEKEALARDAKESMDSANLLRMELDHQNQEAMNMAETITQYQDAVASMTQDVCCHNASLMDLQHQDLGALAELEKYVDQLSSHVSDMVSNKSGTAGQLQALAHRCEELAAERKGLHVVRDRLKESKAKLEEQLEATKLELSSKCVQLDEVQSQLVAAQAESQELKDTQAKLESQLEASSTELQNQRALLDEVQSQLVAAQAESARLAEEVKDTQAKFETMSSELLAHSASNAELQEQLNIAQQELSKTGDLLKLSLSSFTSVQEQFEISAKQNSDLQNAVEAVQAETKDTLQKFNSLLKDNKELLGNLKSLQAEKDEQAQAYESQLEAARTASEAATTQVVSLQEQLQLMTQSMSDEHATHAEAIKDWETKDATLSATVEALNNELASARQATEAAQLQLTDSKQELEAVVEVNKDLQKSLEDVQSQITDMQQQKDVTMQENSGLQENLKSLQAEKDARIQALESQLEEAKAEVVSLQEQLQLMTQSMSDEHATHAEAIKDWVTKYAHLTATVQALQSEVASAQQATKAAREQAAAEVKAAREAEQAAHAATSAMEVQCSTREAGLLQRIVEQGREQAAAMSEQAAFVEKLRQVTADQLQQAAIDKQQLQNRIKELEEDLSRSLDRAKADASDYENQIAQLELERDDLIQKSTMYLAERNSLAAGHGAELSKLSGEVAAAQRAQQQADSKVAELTSQLNQLQKEVDQLTSSLHATKLEKQQAETERDAAKMESASLREEKSQLEAVCAEAVGLQEDDQQLLDANRELTCNARKLLLKYQALQQQVTDLSAAASQALQETHSKPLPGQHKSAADASVQANVFATASNGIARTSTGMLTTSGSSESDKPTGNGNTNAAQLQLQVVPSDSVSLPVPPLALSPTGVKHTGTSSVTASPRAFKRLFSSEGGQSPRTSQPSQPARNGHGLTEVTVAEVQALRASNERVTMDLMNSRALLAEQQVELQKLRDALISKEKQLYSSSQRANADNDTFMSDVGRAGTPKASTPTSGKKGTALRSIITSNTQDPSLTNLVGELRHVTERHQQLLRAAASPRCSTSPRGSFSPMTDRSSAGGSSNPRSPGIVSPVVSPTALEDAFTTSLKVRTNAAGRPSAGMAGQQPNEQLSLLQANYAELLDYLGSVQNKLKHLTANEQSSPASRQPRTPPAPIQSSYPGAL